MSVSYDGRLPALEDFWACMEDNFEARRRGFFRLTVPQIKDFKVETNIPNELKDDGVIHNPTYDETMVDKNPLSPIKWFEKEEIDIDIVTEKVVERTR